jgi:hypothetical protein
LKIGMRSPTGMPSHDPVSPGAKKFQRPTRVSATKVMPRRASQGPGPSRPSGVSRKSPAYSLPGSPPTTTMSRPRCLRGVAGVRITTTWVNDWPNDSKSMYSTRLVKAVVAG